MNEVPYLDDLAAMKCVDPDELLASIINITGPENAEAGVKKLYDAWVSIKDSSRKSNA
jgi:hypothetical protein